MKHETHTAGSPNGYWLDESTDSIANMYIKGCADGFCANWRTKADQHTLSETCKAELPDIIRSYYKINPENKPRQIAAVVRQYICDGELFIKSELRTPDNKD